MSKYLWTVADKTIIVTVMVASFLKRLWVYDYIKDADISNVVGFTVNKHFKSMLTHNKKKINRKT